MAVRPEVHPAPTPTKKQEPACRAIGPPESLEPAVIYKLYRGATGEIAAFKHRIWVEFPALQLCWTHFDVPARARDRVSLLDISRCTCEKVTSAEGEDVFSLDIFTQPHSARARRPPQVFDATEVDSAPLAASAPLADNCKQVSKCPQCQEVWDPPLGSGGQCPSCGCGVDVVHIIRVTGPQATLHDFGVALQQLFASRDTEGKSGLEFIQRRLFQYLWKHQGDTRSEAALYEAQAVLTFNLVPKEGVAYLKSKLGKNSDTEVGEWLAQMSTQKGGLDPTMLGNYFSRRDTLDVFRTFVRNLDFANCDIVAALRLLFDTFKPGGEGQVITRILEYFSEAYFAQWKRSTEQDNTGNELRAAYKDADSVLQVSVSLIMLNTGLHVASKKLGKNSASAQMSLEEYITNTRRVLDAVQVPDEVLQSFYDHVKNAEISLQPLPRVAFSNLPVQPDIEGWLITVLSAQDQRRFWAVLALQRLYLFSDSSDVEPCDAIDLKEKRVLPVMDDPSARQYFAADFRQPRSLGQICPCLASGPARRSREWLPDAEGRAFEVRCIATSGLASDCSGPAPMLTRLGKPRERLALVAESPDLMEKWVNLITSGPY